MSTPEYVLDNGAREALRRMIELERLYDPVTGGQLLAINPRPGWRCWEVGAGGGSIARALAHVVGPTGHVWATDTNLGPLLELSPDLARVPELVTVLEHNVVTDQPPARGLDLIHVRLLASHLGNAWPLVLPTLLTALRPGGWLVVEDLDPMLDYVPRWGCLSVAEEAMNRVGAAFTKVLASKGGDPWLGRRLHHQLGVRGLDSVYGHGVITPATAGSPAARLMQANIIQTAHELVALGVSEEDLGLVLDALGPEDPEGLEFCMPVFWSVRGRKARQP